MENDKTEHKYAKMYEYLGYIINDEFPWCEEHCSQMMLNPECKLECVVCSGNELCCMFFEK